MKMNFSTISERLADTFGEREALVNIEVYENSVGIGEHPDLVEAVEAQVDKYVHALEMVEGVNGILGE